MGTLPPNGCQVEVCQAGSELALCGFRPGSALHPLSVGGLRVLRSHCLPAPWLLSHTVVGRGFGICTQRGPKAASEPGFHHLSRAANANDTCSLCPAPQRLGVQLEMGRAGEGPTGQPSMAQPSTAMVPGTPTGSQARLQGIMVSWSPQAL